MKKTIVTITGIRPDFIRMRNVFRQLDKEFNHIMIHTGQHYDDALSGVFFKELAIRTPDYILETGIKSKTHYEHLANLAVDIIELFNQKNIHPDLILFLGDSNSALGSVPLFKEGYKIGHIEGGMRSYDRRMPEEVNRVVCDHVSDYVFVYTPLYKDRLIKENKSPDQIFVVGNTITEIVKEYMPKGEQPKNYLVADIHRHENLYSPNQYRHILEYLNSVGEKLNMPVKLVRFNRATALAQAHDLYKGLTHIEIVGPFGFLDFLKLQYGSFAVISDSGTAQEECPLLKIPVAVPRLYTERPESVDSGCSILVGETDPVDVMTQKTIEFFRNYVYKSEMIHWLGDGKTSQTIVSILKRLL